MGDPRTDRQVDTIVVGGSQSGLAAGYHLRRLGVRFVILDAHDRVGDAWRTRWESLRLFTTARYSSLPGMPFPEPSGTYPTKDQMADYLEAYAGRFDLPVVTGCRVRRLTRTGAGFEVDTGDRILVASQVVVATGASHTPRVPAFADDLDPGIRQLHSHAYRDPSQLVDGDVLVVGAGNSGAEIALEVARRHETWLSGRDTGQEPTSAGTWPDRLLTPLLWLAATRVLTVNSPIGRRVRDQFFDPPRGIPLGRVRRKDFRVAGIRRVGRTVDVRDGRPLLDDGATPDVSNVVWCTGFVHDYSWIDLPTVPDDRPPEHDRGVVGSEPGLYLVGLPFQHSLSSALVGGVGRDAAHVVEHLARHVDRPAPDRPGHGAMTGVVRRRGH